MGLALAFFVAGDSALVTKSAKLVGCCMGNPAVPAVRDEAPDRAQTMESDVGIAR
jgi:hypothetical protein